MEEKPTLFLEFHGNGENSVQEQIDMTKSICVDDYDAFNFRFTSGEEERKQLWAARHQLYYASIWLREGATGAIVTDACVPLSKLADLMTQTANDVKELGVVGPCFGHAGDGNFHCILPMRDDDSEEYLSRLHQVNDNLIRRTMESGGTCTGEHGIGYGKIKYLAGQYGDGAVHMMKLIKNSLDPKNIMNPGKVVPC
jgi:D-lactate dehydrogenase (cytochrome)